MKTKVCSTCKEEKRISEFCKQKDTKDGLRSQCKECQKVYRRVNSKKANEYQKAYYTKNANKIRDKRKEYYKANSDRFIAEQKEYYRVNHDAISKRQRNHRALGAKYSSYHNKLTVDEEPKLADDGISLEVRCKYCGKYFVPTNMAVGSRVTAIKSIVHGDQHLYCSEGCKYSCSTYNQTLYPKDHKQATSREVQPQLRKLVLERDNWTCQKCGETDTLHCHHIDPVKNNPIESADVDNCITFCYSCHIESHQQDGCRYSELAKC